MMTLAAAALLAALAPGAAAAAGGPSGWVVQTEACQPSPVVSGAEVGGWVRWFGSISEYCGRAQVQPVFPES